MASGFQLKLYSRDRNLCTGIAMLRRSMTSLSGLWMDLNDPSDRDFFLVRRSPDVVGISQNGRDFRLRILAPTGRFSFKKRETFWFDTSDHFRLLINTNVTSFQLTGHSGSLAAPQYKSYVKSLPMEILGASHGAGGKRICWSSSKKDDPFRIFFNRGTTVGTSDTSFRLGG